MEPPTDTTSSSGRDSPDQPTLPFDDGFHDCQVQESFLHALTDRKRSGNPYARIDARDEDNHLQPYDPEHVRHVIGKWTRPEIPIQGISKKDFQVNCRQILSGYMPHGARGRLRDEYRDFIARNESRSPAERAYILSELKKYDLRSTPGIRPYFHREDQSLVDKLKTIEKAADDVMK